MLRFEIRDDGAGFDMRAAPRRTGHGFVNMQDRLGAFGGRVEVVSAVGEAPPSPAPSPSERLR